jgi:hypothetical protein
MRSTSPAAKQVQLILALAWASGMRCGYIDGEKQKLDLLLARLGDLSKDEQLASYPSESCGQLACVCGATYSSGQSGLIYHCSACEGSRAEFVGVVQTVRFALSHKAQWLVGWPKQAQLEQLLADIILTNKQVQL